MNIKKEKEKIHPYTEESLKLKDMQLKLMMSLVDSLLAFQIVNSIFKYLNKELSFLMIIILYGALFLAFYMLKRANKNLNFSDWDYLDDEFPISMDRNIDGENSNVNVTKYLILIVANILIILPISLTFSALTSSIISFIVGIIIKDIAIVNILKFTLIFIFFKSFFESINKIFINYIRDKEVLNK